MNLHPVQYTVDNGRNIVAVVSYSRQHTEPKKNVKQKANNDMRRSDRTNMGGQKSGFPTTRWSQIGEAESPDEARRRIVVDDLVSRYWKPVYCYLSRKGYPNESAKDLTQSFFHELVLGRELIQKADKAKGRFRTFLLTALDHYLINVHRDRHREKRRPKGTILSLEAFDEASVGFKSKDMKPAEAFTYVWALELLHDVLAEVEAGCRKDGKSEHWEVFAARVLNPIMAQTPPEPLPQLCSRLGIKDQAKASNMMITVKRRFQAVMKSRVRLYVDSDEDVEKEIQDLMTVLSQNRP